MAALVKYPEELPAPLNGGVITPTERRFATTLPGMKNYRTSQRDYLGTKNVIFIYTQEQAEKFRFWWDKWLARGAGFFAADWPLLQKRKDNVFRFVKPPQWELIGGRNDGTGYWRVSGTVEIRGRGMLPELPIYSVSSRPYPIPMEDYDMEFTGPTDIRGPAIVSYSENANFGGVTSITASYTQVKYTTTRMATEEMQFGGITGFTASYTGVKYTTTRMATEEMQFGGITAIGGSMLKILIVYNNYETEVLDYQGVTSITASGTRG